MAIKHKLVLRVAVLPVPRSAVAYLLPLVLDLPYARLASAADIIRNFYELENVLLRIVSCVQNPRKGTNSRSADIP